MMTSKNFAWKLGSLLLGGGLYFIFFLFLMRKLGPAEYGKLAFAMSWSGIFCLLVDYGFNPLITRDLSIQPVQGRAYFKMATLTKVGFMLVSGALLFLASFLYPAAQGLLPLIFAMFLFQAATSFVEMGQAFSYAYSFFASGAVLQITHKILIAVAGAWTVVAAAHTLTIAANMSIAAIIGAVLTLAYFQFTLPAAADTLAPRSWATFLREAAPLFIGNILILIYIRIDTVLLNWLRGNEETGLYSAAYRFYEVSNVIPTAYTAAIAAVFSKQMNQVGWQLPFRKHLSRCCLLAVAAWAILQLIAKTFSVGLLTSSYEASQPMLQALSWGTLFMYPNYVLMASLVYQKKQKRIAMVAACGVIINIAANLWAIPRWGGLASAWCTVLTEAVISAASLYFITVDNL